MKAALIAAESACLALCVNLTLNVIMKVHCKFDEMVPVADLKPYSRNRNSHPPDQVQRLAKLLTYQGMRAPIVIAMPWRCIAKGHGTVEAIKLNGWTSAPVVYQTFEDEDQLYAYVQSDNAIQSWGELDLKGINTDLGTLGPFDIDLLGIKDFVLDMSEKDSEGGDGDADSVPEVPKVAKASRGDLFTLGHHRLLCGDSTVASDVERLMNGEKADMVFADPPYGVSFEQGKNIGRSKQGSDDRGFDPIENDQLRGDGLKDFLIDVWANIPEKEGIVFYCWSPPLLEGAAILQSLVDSGWHIQSQLIWNKTPFVIGRADYHWKHEICWYGYKGKDHQWFGGRDKSTVWDVPKLQCSDLHPTMKPVKLAEIACANSTKEKDLVFDPFSGSGTVLIGCENTNRRCYGLEINPAYCDVILDRFSKFSGKDPIREDGVKWSEIKNSQSVPRGTGEVE